jgi:hypothetical protein
MTTYAPHDPSLDERTKQAWEAYRDALADVQGKAYDEAESTAWNRLQDELRAIEEDRAESPTSGDGVH